MAGPAHPYEQLVFSGGGLRCFWQGGFVEALEADRPLRPERVTGVSGGALAGACWLAGRERALLRVMTRAFADQDGNTPFHAREGDGLTPHQRIYRQVVEEVLDAEAQDRVAQGPQFQILVAHPPTTSGAATAGTLAAMLYEIELHLKSSPDFSWPRMAGVGSSLIDARAVARDGRLDELVIAAATIPPIFECPLWDGDPVIDGGMISQIPMPEPDRGRTLVMLTREYRDLPEAETGDRVFVSPSRETPADKIDFSDPKKIERTWELGERDGRAFLGRARGA
ncbi:MAG: patatin-like phospholipase family protein [Tranquillimonas sp.]